MRVLHGEHFHSKTCWLCKTFNKFNIWVLTSSSLTFVPAIWLHSMPQCAFNYLRNEMAFKQFLQSLIFLEEVICKFWEKIYWQYLNVTQSFSFLVSSKWLNVPWDVFEGLYELKTSISLKKSGFLISEASINITLWNNWNLLSFKVLIISQKLIYKMSLLA